jgi:thiol peroxidase
MMREFGKGAALTVERAGVTEFGGKPITLVGPEIQVGERAPAFEVLGTDMRPLSSDLLEGKAQILLSILSVDTNVCRAEMKEFSRRLSTQPGLEVLVVSTDLPFNMKRWAVATDVTNITFGSDHRELSFGRAWGVLMKEVRLFSRAAFVVNPAGEVTHAEYVPVIGDQPDFDAVWEAAKEAATASEPGERR